MNTSTLYRNIAIGLFCSVGLVCLVSGKLTLSTMLFGMASLVPHLRTFKPVRI